MTWLLLFLLVLALLWGSYAMATLVRWYREFSRFAEGANKRIIKWSQEDEK